MQTLTDKELLRYDRQITLKGFDIDKQTALKNASALIIGVGGLGCSASLFLAKSGIGMLTLVDFDCVSESNLSRQILFNDQSIGHNKAEEAKKTILASRQDITINCINKQLDDEQLTQQIAQHDIVLDCSDNLPTRQQINHCCYQLKKPLISGAVIRMEGLLTTFVYAPNQPCYHCLSSLFGQQTNTCVESGVMSPLVGTIGTLQALEAIKVITHYGTPLIGRLLMVDAMTMQFNELKFEKRPHCPICQHD
ncbi:molybdopterin-synthase adenylyltransferase MoeB [Orbaceae bacterium ac157xtp]